jgi:glyoxylase-like metal-dependent hydrolase (beta-lactamase superfamily II)
LAPGPASNAPYRSSARCATPRSFLAAALLSLCACALDAATVKVADGVYAITGSGGDISPSNGGRTANVAFIVGARGVAVVNSGASYRQGEDIIASVASVSDLPIGVVILTHAGQEAVFGAAAFQERGIPVLAHRSTAELISSRCATCLRNLRAMLGDDLMVNSRVVKPDRLIDGDERLEVIGRPLRLIAPPWSSAPGAIAVFDEKTSTLVTGNLVSIYRIPDLRDADRQGWLEALAKLRSLRCRHLVPGFGPIGTCADVDALVRYFDELETRVSALINEGVGLADLRKRCDLPDFAGWDQYDELHPQNAHRTYLRIESSQFR